MKILMIGLGSIGQRHLRNIKALYGDKHEIIAYRVRGLSQTFSKDMKIREGVNLEQEFGIKAFYDLDSALNEKPDIAFITNITSEHMKCAIKCAEAGCNLFIEKPLSNNLQEVGVLKEIIKKNKIIVFMGFQNRYNCVVAELKKLLLEGVLGKIVCVNVEMGERLETMHSYEDYSTTYMANKNMGGGVILNQAIHELDYIYWLFGKPEKVYAVGGKVTSLKIDVEDNCSAIFTVNKVNHKFPIYLHADFIQSPAKRLCKVIGEKGYIEIDLLKNSLIKCIHDRDVEYKKYEDFERNLMFINELEDFMKSVIEKKNPKISLDDGIISLQMAIAMKESLNNDSVVYIE